MLRWISAETALRKLLLLLAAVMKFVMITKIAEVAVVMFVEIEIEVVMFVFVLLLLFVAVVVVRH